MPLLILIFTMSTSLLPTQLGLSSSDPQASLRLSQQAPSFLQTQPSRFPSFPFSIFTQRETPELWTSYEQLLAACLRTGDDKSARECLDRLSSRFGKDNERVMGLQGLYDEATAADEAALKKVLEKYDSILKENPVNVVSNARFPRRFGHGLLTICVASVEATDCCSTVSRQSW